MRLASTTAPQDRRPSLVAALPISWTAALLAGGLAASSGCIPPELGAGSGTGGHAGSGTGGHAGSGAGTGVSGGFPGGAGGGTTGLCVEADCAAAGGMCQAGACVFSCAQTDACPTKITCPKGMPCRVECGGGGSCETGVDCSNATSCEVACDGDQSCGTGFYGAAIDCPSGGGKCQVWCEQSACHRMAVNAIGGAASVVCEGDSACYSLACHGACDITCGATDACYDVTCTTGSCSLSCAAPSTCVTVGCSDAACQIDCPGSSACGTVDCSGACACDLTCGSSACSLTTVCPESAAPPASCSSGKGCTSAPAGCSTCP